MKNIESRNYICKHCYKWFKHKSSLSRHKMKHFKKFLCYKCNLKFTQKYNLQRHLKKNTNCIKLFKKENYSINTNNNLLIENNNYKSTNLNNNNNSIKLSYEEDKSFTKILHENKICQDNKIFIKHNEHFDILCNGFLINEENKNNEIHSIEEFNFDKNYGEKINNLHHYKNKEEIIKLIENKTNINSYNLKICNINNEGIINKGKFFECCKKNNCICKISNNLKHTHGSCGHQKFFHQDHYDYIVDNVLHHQINNRCYYHGKLELKIIN